ncbi:MAG: transglutaminase domain-containing protein [Candidatus Omnitrophica bacterium]|nr:transglutaminase domain-containing protein [Candidatus Omnitrophota bacterium]
MDPRWKKALAIGWMIAALCAWPMPQVASEPGRGQNSLEAIARSCATPEQLARFLQAKISFQDDARQFGRPDYWQDPEELLTRGKGDCEDYALLAQAVLSRQGIEAFVFSLYGEGGYAHTVCVFEEDGGYNVINEDRLIRYRARSLQELATELYPRWIWGAVAQKTGHRGRAGRQILRS